MGITQTDHAESNRLPPGQIARSDFPRFGITALANFKTPVSTTYSVVIGGDTPDITLTQDDFAALERVEQVSDFHCVTTWSYRGVRWSGFRLRDVYQSLIQPHIPAGVSIRLLVLRGQDKYKSSLLLEDALADNVLLADRLDGQPLSSAHGAPLRVVAPAHYGYKNMKHLARIELLTDASAYRPRFPRIMEHPRARVAHEERGRWFPGWLFRYLYRPLIGSTVRIMNKEA